MALQQSSPPFHRLIGRLRISPGKATLFGQVGRASLRRVGRGAEAQWPRRGVTGTRDTRGARGNWDEQGGHGTLSLTPWIVHGRW